jgi:hypothetical protein
MFSVIFKFILAALAEMAYLCVLMLCVWAVVWIIQTIRIRFEHDRRITLSKAGHNRQPIIFLAPMPDMGVIFTGVESRFCDLAELEFWDDNELPEGWIVVSDPRKTIHATASKSLQSS